MVGSLSDFHHTVLTLCRIAEGHRIQEVWYNCRFILVAWNSAELQSLSCCVQTVTILKSIVRIYETFIMLAETLKTLNPKP